MTQCANLNIAAASDTSTLTITAITGLDSVIKGDMAPFTVAVKNIGSISGSANVYFYVSTTPSVPISTQATGTIAPGETKYIYFTIDTSISTWMVGTFSICAKTSDDSFSCTPFEIRTETSPTPVTEAGGSAILIGGLAIGALMMMMSKKK